MLLQLLASRQRAQEGLGLARAQVGLFPTLPCQNYPDEHQEERRPPPKMCLYLDKTAHKNVRTRYLKGICQALKNSQSQNTFSVRLKSLPFFLSFTIPTKNWLVFTSCLHQKSNTSILVPEDFNFSFICIF